MAYFETDTGVLTWFERALTHSSPHVRRQALQLLEQVDSSRRERWLRRASLDTDPTVSATATVVAALVEGARLELPDLFESDVADGIDATDLQWEWEYAVYIVDDLFVPHAPVLVWTREEDEHVARRLALMKCYAGKESQAVNGTAVIVSKCYVNRYTRSPRTATEAKQWRAHGRPRYAGP